MKKMRLFMVAGALIGSLAAQADPASDLEKLRNYYKKRFPKIDFPDYINGVYAIDADSREQWEDIEEFPPYEEFVDKGRDEWNKKFANGKDYASCFKGKEVADIKVSYPYWDEKKQMVRTLELDLNKCREANGEKPLKWKRGKLAHLSAYVAFEGRGKIINVEVNSEGAKKAYEEGKKFYYTKRGQLNLACADCHVYNVGLKVRSELLSPTLGQTTHFPVFRAKWSGSDKNGDGLGTMHRRYGRCNEQVRAKAFKTQGQEYRNLEFFHTYMSNGLETNGPGYRK